MLYVSCKILVHKNISLCIEVCKLLLDYSQYFMHGTSSMKHVEDILPTSYTMWIQHNDSHIYMESV